MKPVATHPTTLPDAELPNLPANPRAWCWRMRDGALIRPHKMVTRHLHHTLVMIWHHTMPSDARVRLKYVRYSFGPFYSDAYLKEAISIFLTELSGRGDLKPWMVKEIQAMIKYLNNHEALPKQARRIAKRTNDETQ